MASYAIYAARDGIDPVFPASALGHFRHHRVVAGEEDLGLVGLLENYLGVASASLNLPFDTPGSILDSTQDNVRSLQPLDPEMDDFTASAMDQTF